MSGSVNQFRPFQPDNQVVVFPIFAEKDMLLYDIRMYTKFEFGRVGMMMIMMTMKEKEKEEMGMLQLYKSQTRSTRPHSDKCNPRYLIKYSPFGLAVTVLLTGHP